MQCQDLDFAAGCTAAEGWASETRAQFEGSLAHDAGGCLVAAEEGRRWARGPWVRQVCGGCDAGLAACS